MANNSSKHDVLTILIITIAVAFIILIWIWYGHKNAQLEKEIYLLK
jgi:nitrogen fixation-related uncharacterized protein